MDFQPRQDTLAPPQTLQIRWPLALLAPGFVPWKLSPPAQGWAGGSTAHQHPPLLSWQVLVHPPFPWWTSCC